MGVDCRVGAAGVVCFNAGRSFGVFTLDVEIFRVGAAGDWDAVGFDGELTLTVFFAGSWGLQESIFAVGANPGGDDGRVDCAGLGDSTFTALASSILARKRS